VSSHACAWGTRFFIASQFARAALIEGFWRKTKLITSLCESEAAADERPLLKVVVNSRLQKSMFVSFIGFGDFDPVKVERSAGKAAHGAG
jgi:hypothetical protein